MSTFDGRVAEFPDIRIDYFRTNNSAPALAYFLSHVHSDHLTGLETSKSHFIYCSPATRDILLRLEKYPHRMNFAKGILETRKQTYRHLKNLLKAIPLETPTVIELEPLNEIRVTLFDANHCVGAVMFLIQGGGNAILYTGDIRSEAWWVNSLTRNPLLLPYVCTSGREPISKLDSIYLDTTFTVSGRRDHLAEFPSKAEGLRELLQKVSKYPPDTLFYLHAWTFGYEDVWQALSVALGSHVHVDEYRYGVYRALANGVEPKASEAPKLVGYHCGNHSQDGCLSSSSTRCRIHSCEKGMECEIWNKDFVRITPIVSRYGNIEIAEVGVGGGQGDLNEQHELDVSDKELVGQLMALCASKLHGEPKLLSALLQMLTSVMENRVQSIKLEDFNMIAESVDSTADDMDTGDTKEVPLRTLVSALAKVATKGANTSINAVDSGEKPPGATKRSDGLPKQITFPYSRHSSYNELCMLIEAFRPKNIHPCTVDEANWTICGSMSSLFGHIYPATPCFRHDQIMLNKKERSVEKEVINRRPSTPESPASDYATPKAHASLSNTQRVSASKSHRALPSAQDERPIVQRADDSKPSSRESSKQRRQSQGDFWPPLEVDHYSPPPGTKRRASLELQPPSTKRRASSEFPAPHEVQQDKAIAGSKLTPMEKISVGRAENHQRKRLASTLSEEWQFNQDEPAVKRRRSQQSPEYGRLSPPPDSKDGGSDKIDIRGQFVNLVRRQSTTGVRDSGKSLSNGSAETPSPAQNRLAFRKEVHDAVLGKNGGDWSEISLVSVDGHQAKEEEL